MGMGMGRGGAQLVELVSGLQAAVDGRAETRGSGGDASGWVRWCEEWGVAMRGEG